MVKICAKDNCQQQSIPRGKYCEVHRTGRKKPQTQDIERTRRQVEEEINQKQLEDERIRLQKIEDDRQLRLDQDRLRLQKIEEDRQLRRDQELEYNETILKDKERMRVEEEKKENERFEEELAQIIKMSAEMEIENSIEKKKKSLERLVVDENDKNNYKIKFKLKDFTFLKQFNKNSTINDLRNFVDIYIHENNIKIQNYDLVTNFPKEILSDLELELSNTKLSKNCILYIENLD